MRATFGLALQLGMTQGELMARMSAKEFAQWLAFFEIKQRAAERTQEQVEASKWFQLEE